jgi:glucose-6-phosphate 1-dehydrogenase
LEETIHQLRKGLESVKPADPCIMIIFGASGDLTKRKLIPSLYKLYYEKLLPEGFSVIGFSRSPMDHYNFRDAMKEAVKTFIDKEFHDENILNKFLDMIYYIQSEFTDNACYQKLQALIEKINDEKNCCGNRLFYLAVPPPVFPDIIKKLGENKLNKPCREDAWTRIIVEKPFGHDLVSARELNKIVTKFFKEEQIYRIDHYLGKETVQNLMVMRFGNGIFEPLWNRNYISHVQITAAESIGVENRASYYESAGALRDILLTLQWNRLLLSEQMSFGLKKFRCCSPFLR